MVLVPGDPQLGTRVGRAAGPARPLADQPADGHAPGRADRGDRSRRVMVPVIVACFALPVGRLFVDDQFDAFLDLDGGGGHRRDDRSRDAPPDRIDGRAQGGEVGLAEKAATDERQRIAREVHDVIAHSMTVTMLHVTAARLAVARGDDDAATEALLEAEKAGRESLNEIRHTVGLLRTEPDGGIEAPQPGVGDIVQLVDGFAEAGVDVRLDSMAPSTG